MTAASDGGGEPMIGESSEFVRRQKSPAELLSFHPASTVLRAANALPSQPSPDYSDTPQH